MADSLPELIRFGKKIGCSPNWVQTEGALDHFDLTARMREKAVAHGAVEIDRKQVVEMMRRRSMPNAPREAGAVAPSLRADVGHGGQP
jgi:hypothetical protein